MKKILQKKNWIRVICGLCFLIISLTGCGAQPLSDQFDEDTVKESAEQAVAYFNERDYQAIIDMGNDVLKENITVENFAAQCDPYLDKCGEYQEIEKTIVFGSTDKSTETEYAGIVMIGKYEEGTIQFTIGFDEDMKIVQFLIK